MTQHDIAVKDAALDELRLLRWTTLFNLVGYSKSRIRQMEKDGEFPTRVQLGPNSVAWRYSEVKAWIDKRQRGFTADKTPRFGAYAAKGAKRGTTPARKAKAAKRTTARAQARS